MTLNTLITMAPRLLTRRLAAWYWARKAHHFHICAQVERARADEANRNAAYYDKRAILARSISRSESSHG